MSGNLNRHLAKMMIFNITECLTGRDHYALSSVDSHWIEVFHVTDSHAVIKPVTDDFILDFLPSRECLFYKYLRAIAKRLLRLLAKLFFIGTDAGTQAAKRIGDPQHYWIPD